MDKGKEKITLKEMSTQLSALIKKWYELNASHADIASVFSCYLIEASKAMSKVVFIDTISNHYDLIKANEKPS
jgi:hypothetical protein